MMSRSKNPFDIDLLEKLHKAGYRQAKLSRDGHSIIVGFGSDGFFRVHPDGKIDNEFQGSRARGLNYLKDLKAALE